MPGKPVGCHARNALRPSVLLSRLFNISLARPCPPSTPHRFHIPARFRHGGPDSHDPGVDTSSLSVTLEAHRRANRASIIRKVGAQSVDDSIVWFKPELPVDRFNPPTPSASPPRSDPANRSTKSRRQDGHRTAGKGGWQWSDQATISAHKIGAKEREVPPADYVGQNVDPLYNPENVRDVDLPWFEASQLSNATPLERLRAEIKAFESYLRPTPDEQAGRDAVVAHARKVWSSFSKKLSLDIFGSEKSGLALATSDIDLRVYKPEIDRERDAEKAPRYVHRRQFQAALTKAFPFFQRDPNFMLVFLRHSRYPLLTMQHVGASVDVQIVCSNDTSYARSVMKKYMDAMPTLRSLYTVFRYMFEVRGFSDVFRGGMGSYSVFYLVAAAMKLGPEAAQDDAAAQLLAVLDFWSEFDTTRNWISLDPLEVLPKIENKPVHSKEEKQNLKAHQRIGLQNEDQPYLLCLRDPADPTNDLGRKAFGWKHLQATMKKLSEDLRQKLENDDGSLLLPCVVGRGFDLLEARRGKLAMLGRDHASAQTQNVLPTTEQTTDNDAISSQPIDVSKEDSQSAESEADKA